MASSRRSGSLLGDMSVDESVIVIVILTHIVAYRLKASSLSPMVSLNMPPVPVPALFSSRPQPGNRSKTRLLGSVLRHTRETCEVVFVWPSSATVRPTMTGKNGGGKGEEGRRFASLESDMVMG